MTAFLGSDCAAPGRFRSGARAPERLSHEYLARTVRAHRPAAFPDGQHRHILAINNDPAVLGLFRDLLEEVGFQVTTQNSVNRELEQIKTVAPGPIVLDSMWADEDASWSLLQMLRMDPGAADIPIVLCTGAVHEVGPWPATCWRWGYA